MTFRQSSCVLHSAASNSIILKSLARGSLYGGEYTERTQARYLVHSVLSKLFLFSGKDATRAYITGDFTEKGLTDDLDGVSEEMIAGLATWIEFYQKEYSYMGKLVGRLVGDVLSISENTLSNRVGARGTNLMRSHVSMSPTLPSQILHEYWCQNRRTSPGGGDSQDCPGVEGEGRRAEESFPALQFRIHSERRTQSVVQRWKVGLTVKFSYA